MSWYQVIATISVLLTVALLGWSLWRGRRQSRVRAIIDVVRIVLQCSIALAVLYISAVSAPLSWMAGAAVVGVIVGVLQGQTLQIEVDGGQAYTRRSQFGFILWAAGLLLMQVAGLVNRAGLVELGQTVTWFSVGIAVGLLFSRHQRVQQALAAGPALAGPALLLAVIFLAGCEVEIDSFFNEDGSSIFQVGTGNDPPREDDPPVVCEGSPGDSEDGYVLEYVNREQRGNKTWCIAGLAMTSPGHFARYLNTFNEEGEYVRIHCLAVVEGQLHYDIEFLLEPGEADDRLTWSVTAPNPIVTSNAHSQSETTATWELAQSNGWTRLQINADEGDCPTGGFELHLQAEVSGAGTAFLTVPVLITGDADTQAVIGALATAGWAVSASNPGDDSFVASWSWSDPADLATLGDVLPPLEGSDFTLVTTDDTAMDFDARLDLSFYEAFWQGINPTLDDPPFLFSWAPPVGSTDAGGDWTDDKALQFAWNVDTQARIFNMWTATDDLGTAPASDDGSNDDTDQAGGDGDTQGGTEADSDGESDPGTESDSGAATDAGTGTADQAADGADQGSGSNAGSAGPASDDSDAGSATADKEDVSEREAAAMAIAGLVVAAGMGVLTLGDVMAGNALDAAFGSTQEPTERTEAHTSDDRYTYEEQSPGYPSPEDPDEAEPIWQIDDLDEQDMDDLADEFGARSVDTAYEEGDASTDAQADDSEATAEGDTTEEENPDDTGGDATTEDDSTADETPDDIEADASNEGQTLPSISQQEIDDIYGRGLASGRSLEDLRQDVEGVSQARGGHTEIGNPYGLEMRDTAKGPVPLTQDEFDEYRQQKAELDRLDGLRSEYDALWAKVQSDRAGAVRDTYTTVAAAPLEAFELASERQPQIDEADAWIATLEHWRRGDTWWKSPDGSLPSRNGDTWEKSPDGNWTVTGDGPMSTSRALEAWSGQKRQLLGELRSELDALQQRQSTDPLGDLERADAAQEKILEGRRQLDPQIDRAEAFVDRYEGWSSTGRPLPGR